MSEPYSRILIIHRDHEGPPGWDIDIIKDISAIRLEGGGLGDHLDHIIEAAQGDFQARRNLAAGGIHHTACNAASESGLGCPDFGRSGLGQRG